MAATRYIFAIVLALLVGTWTSLAAAEEAKSKCRAEKNIIVGQRDLGFDHPLIHAWVTSTCPCAAKYIVVSCPPQLTQDRVDPSNLRILGGGRCLLRQGTTLPPHGTIDFSYLANDPIPLTPLTASFSNECM
jgi:hypothetical protein